MDTCVPTGRFRYRAEQRLLRKPLVVLQIEIHSKGHECDSYGGGCDYDYTFWRDAEIGDVTTKES